MQAGSQSAEQPSSVWNEPGTVTIGPSSSEVAQWVVGS